MLIYRLEDKNGLGPFSSMEEIYYNGKNYIPDNFIKGHKAPYADYGINVNPNMFFGWNTLEKTTEFVTDLSAFKESSFMINVYSCGIKRVLPDGQVMFLKSKAKKIKSYEINKFC